MLYMPKPSQPGLPYLLRDARYSEDVTDVNIPFLVSQCKEIKWHRILLLLLLLPFLWPPGLCPGLSGEPVTNVQTHSKTHNDYRSDMPDQGTMVYRLLQAEAAGLGHF